MKMQFSELSIPMRYGFKHSSAERHETSSVWVTLTSQLAQGLGEGCPRTYVTGESMQSALHWLKVNQTKLEALTSLTDLRTFLHVEKEQIDQNPAAFCAFETAFLDALSQEQNLSVEDLLGIQKSSQIFYYTAVVSDGDEDKFDKSIQQYLKLGFRDFKFKISGDLSLDQSRLLRFVQLAQNEFGFLPRVRLDANNLWSSIEEAIDYLRGMSVKLYAIEEPLQSKNSEQLAELSVKTQMPIILDECLLTQKDAQTFAQLPGTFIGNIRISKNGGLLRSIALGQALKGFGIKVIVGAQVGETSVLTRAAQVLVSALEHQVVAQEGAYGELLLQAEPVTPSVQFGARGILDLNQYQTLKPFGWGLKLKESGYEKSF